jgi:hypothetical protein
MTTFWVIMVKRQDSKVYPDLHKTTQQIYLTEEDAESAFKFFEYQESYHIVKLIAFRDEVMTNLERLQSYDEELSKVMFPDFKDWWQNSKNEWPLVSRLVIEDLRKDNEWCYDTIDIMSQKIKDLEAEIEYLKYGENS